MYKKPKQKRFEAVARLLKGYGFGAKRLSEILECSPATASRKLADPERLTLFDIDRIVRFGHVPCDEVKGAMKF